ncbi:MAG: TonB-dependent receptor [Sinobacteraceae bacterium]|nr:TonB-dependent receptor [Nevskiaceae bacterium]
MPRPRGPTQAMTIPTSIRNFWLIAALSLPLISAAEEAPLHEVVVTATRLAADPFNLPAGISSIPAEQLRQDALGVNLADDIGMVPGLLARNRYNYAQDQQVSIRGIGANSTFGIRGVRVYQDGIPATGPDGQGQISQFNLDSASRVEVLRGPFSALYGNSSGGVIQIFTADGQGPLQLRPSVVYGSFDNLRAGLDVLGSTGALGYNLDYTHFQVDGFRDHSAAKNDSFNSKLNYSFNDANRLALIANVVARPDAQDPLGLTPAEYAADPDSTDAAATLYDTRKSLQQQQAGLIYDLDISPAQSVRLLGYGGHRIVQQFLAIPASSQRAPTSAGGVVGLNRQYGGTDARWSWKSQVLGGPMSWVAGVSFDRQNELRRGYNNFVGATLGVQGTLRRNENDIARNFDEYLQGSWDFLPDWSLTAGARHSDVRFDSVDHYITATNGDDSGSTRYQATSPVAGLVYKALPWLNLYSSYGQGFQTPIGSELAYRPDGSAGLNFELRPARSDNTELGAKIQLDPGLTAELAVFQALTRNEIVVDTNVGGRSTYQNSGRTRRQGAEVFLNYRWTAEWQVQLAYTYVNAFYSDAYHTCVAAPCRAPSLLVSAGNRLPGVPKSNLFGLVHWGAELGPHASVSAQYVGAIAVNDANTVFTPSYALAGIDGGYSFDLRAIRLNVFLRLNDLMNRRYVGSVIVDDGNTRYFEPGPGFNLLGGVSALWK